MVRVRRWWDSPSVRWFLCVRVERGLVLHPTRHDVGAQDMGSDAGLLRDMGLSSRNKENCLVLETFRDMSQDR